MMLNKPKSSNENKKVDYNKTVMANDVPQQESIDYNKTMMAADLPQINLSNKNRSDSANNASKATKKKKASPVIFIVLVVFILSADVVNWELLFTALLDLSKDTVLFFVLIVPIFLNTK